MKKHSDTGTDINALEDICRPIYAEVYAKHNVYVLCVAWKGNDFT
jgi:hypothetical protein